MRPIRFTPFSSSSLGSTGASNRRDCRPLRSMLIVFGLVLLLCTGAGAGVAVAAPVAPLPIAASVDLTGSFSSIWASAADDIWITSTYSGNVFHFDGYRWAEVATGFNGSLSALWGSGPTNLYAVGRDYDTYQAAVLHFDGKAWHKTTFDVGLVFSGVWGSGPDDVYVVGTQCGACAPSAADIANPVGRVLVLHFDGRTWSQIESSEAGGLQSVHGRGPDDIYAVGHSVYGTGAMRGLIMHFDGRTWRRVDRADDARIYKAVWTTATGVYAAADGAIVRFDGTRWTTTQIDAYINALWGSGDEILAVGSAVYHSDGKSWLPLSTNLTTDTLRGIWAFEDASYYAVGADGVFQVLGATVEHHYSHLPLVARPTR